MEPTKEQSQDRRIVKDLETLISTKEWKTYEGLLERQLLDRQRELFAPCSGMDAALQLEYKKGAVYGIMLCRDLPSGIIQMAEEQKPKGAKEEENEK